MITYRHGPVEITIVLEQPAALGTWLTHLRPHLRALHGPGWLTEMAALENTARRILTTEAATYGETSHGVVDIAATAMILYPAESDAERTAMP
ncbi:hypothetical protein AB0C65_38555 [Nocardia sp. NPDC048505]|uniref:hypothetical protein n=1 Tax=Nocardia sp. NPDC048505 TaxID=3155756 RepID=UPI0034007A81